MVGYINKLDIGQIYKTFLSILDMVEFSLPERNYIESWNDVDHGKLAEALNKARRDTQEDPVTAADIEGYLSSLSDSKRLRRSRRRVVGAVSLLSAAALIGFCSYTELDKNQRKDEQFPRLSFGLETEEGAGWGVVQLSKRYVELENDLNKIKERIILRSMLEDIANKKGPDALYAAKVLDKYSR